MFRCACSSGLDDPTSSGTEAITGLSNPAGMGGGGIFVGVGILVASVEVGMWCDMAEGRPLEVMGGGGLEIN